MGLRDLGGSRCLLLCLRHETGYEAVGDGGSYPDLREHVVGIFVDRHDGDVIVVKGGNDHVDDADGP